MNDTTSSSDFTSDMSSDEVRAAEPEYFHRLVNIEDHPDFLATANQLARHYLDEGMRNEEQAPPGSNLKRLATYADDLFETHMRKIYDGFVATMYEPHWFESGILTFPNESGRARRFPIGRVSDKVVRERLFQMAPFNLVDGAWLQNILAAGPSDSVRSSLFAIWEDEAGNGDVSRNHANVYDALLKSLNIYLPPITSREFIQQDFLPGAFTGAVFQLAVGQSPQQFFPELLGMTLYLEWEASPTLTPMTRMLLSRGLNAHFFQLHVAIDNITAGHGALALQAVKDYLADKREEGGEAAVDLSWRRVWNGYVTWATLGGFGRELTEHSLVLERKQINISADPGRRVCWPDFAQYERRRMLALVERKASVARQMHGGKLVGGQSLNALFADPPHLLDLLVSTGLVDPERARDSRLIDLMRFSGPMYEVFTADEKEVVLDWIESLRPSQARCVDPLPPQPVSADLPGRVAGLISDKAAQAATVHEGIVLADESGNPVALRDWFASPTGLMKALVAGGWIVPGEQDRSIFLSRLIGAGGPMSAVFSDDERHLLQEWIEQGAQLPSEEPRAFSAPPDGGGGGAGLLVRDVAPEVEEAQLRHLLGMGAVH